MSGGKGREEENLVRCGHQEGLRKLGQGVEVGRWWQSAGAGGCTAESGCVGEFQVRKRGRRAGTGLQRVGVISAQWEVGLWASPSSPQ